MKQFLSILCCAVFSIFSTACGDMKFQTNTNPEDQIIELPTLSESPKSKEQNYQVGEKVAVIESDGIFTLMTSL